MSVRGPDTKKRPGAPCGNTRPSRQLVEWTGPLWPGNAYWIAAPPEGDAVSVPALIVLVACQIVPVVFVKKWRVPVEDETGSAQA